jgi:hypothetical protein
MCVMMGQRPELRSKAMMTVMVTVLESHVVGGGGGGGCSNVTTQHFVYLLQAAQHSDDLA